MRNIVSSEDAHEASWMKKFIRDVGEVPSIQDPLDVFHQNYGDITLAKEPRSHKKTRHISLRFNFFRNNVEEGEINIRKV